MMLDPSMPWIASGYKKFLPQDFHSRHSKNSKSWEDDLYHVPDTPSLVSHQRRRVKSATTSGRHRSHPKPPEQNIPLQYRPKSAASRVIRKSEDTYVPGDRINDFHIQTAYRLPRRPKSAIHVRHRPSQAQNKSVTEVERIHNARLMVSTIPVGRTTTNKPCAFCPVECRPKSSSSQRPISSTGLLAADVPSHFDRSNFWAKGTSRPRTAPTSRREFLHLPRHNYIRRGNVPHYTHFIKGLNLFPRDGSPLPHPTPPKPEVVMVGDEGDISISSRHGGSTFKDDDTLGCGRSEIDDSDWEDIDSDHVDGTPGEDEADEVPSIEKTGQEIEAVNATPEIDIYDIQPDTGNNEQQDESSQETNAVISQPDSIENQEKLTPVDTQDEVTPAGIHISIITENTPEEDVDQEVANISVGNDEDVDFGAEEEESFPPAPSPSPVTIQTDSEIPGTTDIVRDEQGGESEVEKEADFSNSEKGKSSETPTDVLEKVITEDQNDISLKMEKEVKDKNLEKPSNVEKVKLEKNVGGLTPTVKMIPTPPVKEGHDSSPGVSKKVERKQSQPTKRSKVKKEVRIKEPDAEKAVKPGEEDVDKKKGQEISLENKKKTEVIDTVGKSDPNMGCELKQPTPEIMLSGERSPGTLDELHPTPKIVLSEEKSPSTSVNPSSQEKAAKKESEKKVSSDTIQKEDPAQVSPKLGPPPPRMKVDIMGTMDSEEILDLEMRLRRKGPGSYISDTEESLSDLLETPSTKNAKTLKKFVAVPWNCCRVALSRQAGRFEMPMDIRELVGMTPVQYLLKYCKVNAQRKALYKRTFSRVDKDCDGKINRKELDRAVTEVLVDTVNEEQLASVLKMIGIDEDNLTIKFHLFAPLCALLERLYYSHFVTEDSSDREARLKDRLEDADFTALDWKLDGYELDENLRNLLYML